MVVFNTYFRQDMLCPPAWAQELRDKVRKEGGQADLTVVEGAQHSELDPGMEEAMAKAVREIVSRLGVDI